MDNTYDMFRRLMVNWQRSLETREAKPGSDEPSRSREEHGLRLITYRGYSAPGGSLVLEEE